MALQLVAALALAGAASASNAEGIKFLADNAEKEGVVRVHTRPRFFARDFQAFF